MSFDRTKPVNGTTVDAALLRGNMNDLDDRVAAMVPIPGPPGPLLSSPLVGNAEFQGTVFVQGELGLYDSDPPTQAEIQSLAAKLDELINALKRT